ncbi:MAG: hypothetical protein KBD46_02595 [Candidatus Levybacteria bacterium]|nr:hypothetical protein [Candidatus Levybacteria bacterium]
MIGRLILLMGTAVVLDGLFFYGTVPLTRLVASFLVPSSIFIGPEILQAYGLVVFGGCLALLLFLLWMFERYYVQWFDFWDLLVTMVIVMAIIVYGRDMVPLGLIGRI